MFFKTKRPLIFIVDNNTSYQRVIAGCLGAIGLFNIRLFHSGEQCISQAAKNADIIVLENNLGEEKWSGLEFMQKYKRINSDTNFLFYTTASEAEVAVRIMRLGALDYIVKSKKGLSELSSLLLKFSTFYQKKLINRRIRIFLIILLLLLLAFVVLMTVNYTTGF